MKGKKRKSTGLTLRHQTDFLNWVGRMVQPENDNDTGLGEEITLPVSLVRELLSIARRAPLPRGKEPLRRPRIIMDNHALALARKLRDKMLEDAKAKKQTQKLTKTTANGNAASVIAALPWVQLSEDEIFERLKNASRARR